MDTHDLRAPASAAGQRLDSFWYDWLDHEIARTAIQNWIRAGLASINGQVCRKPSTRLIPGQRITLNAQSIPSALVPWPGPLSLVFADQYLAVINKQAGLTVHPAPSVTEPTLLHFAAHAFPALTQMAGERPGIVHRLDKDTTGLILVALHEPTRLALTQAFAEREIDKQYLALVAGEPPASGCIELPIGRHPSIKTRMAVVHAGGRPARTEYVRLWTAPDHSASLMLVRIHTGRTHQIRVHMTALGHPLLGDAVYADARTAARAVRQMLHAWRLCIQHPHTRQPLVFLAPVPQDFLDQIRLLCQAPLRVGLTGATGSGKSTVRRMLEQEGLATLSADDVVAATYEPGQDGWQILRHYFGTTFVPADTAPVDKAALYQAMRSSESLRREIERLIHPVVRQAVQLFHQAHAPHISVAEIPLLCEAGLQTDHDVVVTVFCPDELRHARLRTRGWDAERIAQVDSWQWEQAAKVRTAQLVVNNSGSAAELQHQVQALARVVRNIQRCRQERHLRAVLALLDEQREHGMNVS